MFPCSWRTLLPLHFTPYMISVSARPGLASESDNGKASYQMDIVLSILVVPCSVLYFRRSAVLVFQNV